MRLVEEHQPLLQRVPPEALGVPEDTLDDVEDEDEPKPVLIGVIRDRLETLRQMKFKDLKREAAQLGARRNEIDDALAGAHALLVRGGHPADREARTADHRRHPTPRNPR